MTIRTAAASVATVALCFLGACQSTPTNLPSGTDSYALIPPPTTSDNDLEYHIGPFDALRITVFQEPDLSFAQLPVDANGNIVMPLIGSVQAAGQTAAQLSDAIAQRLNARYLVDGQVSVAVTSSASQHVTVEGQVAQPGIYEITGSSTLLQALAVAKSPTPTAKLDQVVIFRMIDGKRAGAVFDVEKIRAGEAPDPAIKGGDVVVVSFSALKGAFRDFLKTAPFFNLFRYF